MSRSSLVPVAALALVACSEGAPTYYRDVRPIVEGRCTSCHAEGAIAPFGLDDFEKVKAFGPAVAMAVTSRQMPPWSAGPSDVTYDGDVSLTDAQIQTIVDWVDQGMEKGDASSPGDVLPPTEPAFPGVDLELQLPEPYVPTGRPDDYRCFPVRWTETADKFVTALSVMPGNLEIVHHVGVFILPPENAEKPFVWNEEDERPGYECFGGPSGGREAIPIVQLGAWLPGQSGNVYPNGIGIRVKPGSTVVIQMHYNVVGDDPAPDQSRLVFSLEDSVEREGWYAPFLDVSWPLGFMQIPAGESAVEHEIEEDPRGFFDLVAGETLPFDDGFEVHAVMFHMHQLGEVGRVSRVRRGFETNFLNIQNWDFNWQRQYVLSEPLEVLDGDALMLNCTFDNSAANQDRGQEPVDVNWGEGTGDEMCVANMLVTAR